jgi:diacylglycerol O-acyltransferase / wax synthase
VDAEIPLTPEDRAILDLESATIAGHTCKVVVLGPGAPGVAELRRAVAERLSAAPMLTRRLGGAAGAPAWVPDERFDVAEHVVEAQVDAPVATAELRGAVARIFEQRLDRARPLWRIDSVPLDGGGVALVWRLHHALADGTAAIRYSRALLWDPEPAAEAPGDAGAGGPAAPVHSAAAHEADDARRRAHLAAFLSREFARSVHRPPFDGRIGTRREIAFASAPLRELHDAAKELAGATVNDAVLAIVAGALRRWIVHHHGHLGAVRVKVPVSLHHQGDDAGNRDSFFSLPLPLNEPDPLERLRAVHAATAVRKAEYDAQELDHLLRELGGVSTHLARLCERIERSGRAFAVNVSNVPGPRTAVSVLGAPVEEVHSIAEIGEHHALRVSVVSFAGTLCFGLCADPAVVDDLQAMADGIEAEAAALIGSA